MTKREIKQMKKDIITSPRDCWGFWFELYNHITAEDFKKAEDYWGWYDITFYEALSDLRKDGANAEFFENTKMAFIVEAMSYSRFKELAKFFIV